MIELLALLGRPTLDTKLSGNLGNAQCARLGSPVAAADKG